MENKDQNDSFDAEKYWREQTGKTAENTDESGIQDYWVSLSEHGKGRPGDPDYGPVPEEFRSNGMSKAAFICGILALASLLLNLFGGVFFGALGILFALLSRKQKMSRQAKAGAVMAGAAVVIFSVLVAVSFYALISTGVWNTMIREIREMDPNDPDAVGKVQRDILEELQEKLLGIPGTASDKEAAGSISPGSGAASDNEMSGNISPGYGGAGEGEAETDTGSPSVMISV